MLLQYRCSRGKASSRSRFEAHLPATSSFQQLEVILKYLAAVQHRSTPLSEAEETRKKRADFIRTQTLGQIAGDVVRALYADCDSASSINPEAPHSAI